MRGFDKECLRDKSWNGSDSDTFLQLREIQSLVFEQLIHSNLSERCEH